MSGLGIVVLGGGFAGLWAALSARREAEAAGAALAITLVSESDWLTIRPRLYEPDPARFRVPLRPILEAVDVAFVGGRVADLDLAGRRLMFANGAEPLPYERLVLAMGSVLAPPPVPGAERFAFNVDSYDAACALDGHLAQTFAGPPREGRDTVVVIGGGFTGIELATGMRGRIEAHAGAARARASRVFLLEGAKMIGRALGPGPRPAIEAALAAAGVEVRLGAKVAALDGAGVTLDGGARIAAATVILTTGMRANPLTEQVPAPRDGRGRLRVDDTLRVAGLDGVYAGGDVAHARVDEAGHVALMSCQHALRTGRYAGHNAAREALGLAPTPYRQERYVTCLDLGPWGAVFTRGWQRAVEKSGAEAKAIKRTINGELIYPPSGGRDEILAAAVLDPPRAASTR